MDTKCITAHLFGVSLIPLRQIADDRGKVMHILRKDAAHFSHFGEVYCSCINPGIVKGWKKHKIMTQNLTVPIGRVKFVLFDDRLDSPTYKQSEEIIIGDDVSSYMLLQIPPQLWYSFRSLSDTTSFIINCSTHIHDPSESITVDLANSEIAYKWD